MSTAPSAGPSEARRWSALDPAARRVLAAAALHDGPLSETLLAELAEDPLAVDAVIEDGWLREDDRGEWQLVPASATVRGLASWSLRRAAHRALAAWHSRQAHGAARAAAHFEAGGLSGEAGRAWLAAARVHCRRQQHRAAARCFAEVARLLPEEMEESEWAAAVRDFGTCAPFQRNPDEALDVLERWRERPDARRKPAFQAEAARVLSGLLAQAGRHGESASARRTAAVGFERTGQTAEAAGEWLAAATTLVFAVQLSPARDAAGRALELGRRAARADVVSSALTILGLAQGMLGETAAGKASLESALDESLRAGLTTQAADAYRVLGSVSEYASCYRDEQAAFNNALSYCRRHDEDHVGELCLGCYSYSLFRSGHWRRSLEIARSLGTSKRTSVASRCVADGVLGLLWVHRGEVKPAVARLDACLEAVRRTGLVPMAFFAWWGLALARETRGETAAAAEAYGRLLDTWKGTEDRHDAVPGLSCAVTFFVRQGDTVRAADFAGALQRIASLNPNPEMIGAARQAAAELDLHDGRPADAVPGFAEAVRLYEQRDLSVERVRARLRWGAALAASGEETAARAVWREARLHAGRLGARPLMAAVVEAEAGAGPERRQLSSGALSTALLSPRQRDVARHLTAGCTNKEIAARLGLGVRTVDMHIAHLLARLDCRTRAEAAVKLAAGSGA